MKQKRMSVRFDLSIAEERRAWEHLHNANASMNQTVITAVNAFFEPVSPAVINALRGVMRECLHDVALMNSPSPEQAPMISADESALMDSLTDLLGG